MREKPAMSLPVHLSIVWGVALAVMTLLEWRSLDREPLREPILLPYIERQVQLQGDGEFPVDGLSAGDPGRPGGAERGLMVEIGFNGPLFLACFFGPVLIVHGIAWLLGRVRRQQD